MGLARGADVFARNDRGHTPYNLCTIPEVQSLLLRAMEPLACKATEKQFSSTVLRYMCSWSLDVFCEAAVTQMFVYESPDSEEREQPVTWCMDVRCMVSEAERQLDTAMQSNELDAIISALEGAEGKPVNCKLVHRCQQLKAKLESEIQLAEALKVRTVESLEEFTEVHESLSWAIKEADANGADPERVHAARSLRRTLLSEASLMRAIAGAQKTTTGHLTTLEELIFAARGEKANEDLLAKAMKLVAKLKSEREVQQRVAACENLCVFSSFKQLTPQETPAWVEPTPAFETFHEEYKKVVEQAKVDEISAPLMTVALEQLTKIEHLLIDKKQAEAEKLLKTKKPR